MKRKNISIWITVFITAALCICMVFLVFLQWLASSDIIENQVKYDNGDIIFIPDLKNLSFEQESCTLYYDNLLSVHLLSDLSEKEEQMLAELVDGEIVSNISGCINFVQIKVKKTSLEELNRMADVLNQSKNVLYASYDVPMFMDTSAADNNPWSDNAAAQEEHRGEENDPSGNDWWAEAIGAYTAWEYADSNADELKPVKVGVIDDGFFTGHEDLRGKIEILNGGNMTNDIKGNPSAHGTAVSGIISASNNGLGLRGVADHASLLCADYNFFDEDGNNISLLSSGQYVQITKQLIEENCKVINCSWGATTFQSEDAFHNEMESMKFKKVNDAFWKTGMLEMLYYLTGDNITYDDYKESYRKAVNSYASQATCLLVSALLCAPDKPFLIVQSAGNGFSDTLTGYDAAYTGWFSGITEDLYNRVLGDKATELNDKRGIHYSTIDEHILIVGAVKNEIDENGAYRMGNWSCYGNQVDICAPGERISILDIEENGISKYSFPDRGDSSSVEPFGTSFSAPMVSGAAAFLWSIDPSLSTADVRKLLLESGTSAVGVGEDAGRKYPMLNVGASVKKLTGWSSANDIQEGLYIVPDTHNVLYVEQDESEISITAWWLDYGVMDETTAILTGSDAAFTFGNDPGYMKTGTVHFEESKGILTLEESLLPNIIDKQWEYIWLRDSMLEFSEEQLKAIGQSLGVPEDLEVMYTQDEAYYWEAGERYVTYVQVFYNGEVIAAVTADSFTGEWIRDILICPSTISQPSIKYIPVDAVRKNGHYYYIFDVADVTNGQAAIDFCKEQNGYLATITSEEENEFLFNYMVESGYQNAYFGFSDFEEEGNWKWLNGEEVSFTNWHDGEPNGGSSENYAMFYEKYPDGTWNDGGLANSNGEVFICEWEQ